MLNYNISAQILHGAIGLNRLAFTAYSGGGRGSTSGIARKDLSHWSSDKKAPEPFSTANRGGPLPSGMYKVTYRANHDKFGECAFLEPTLTALLRLNPFDSLGVSVTDRDRFYIHRSGRLGSDGCIVPREDTDLKHLLRAIKSAREAVFLNVYSEGLGGDVLDA
jgi:hypothetical protein